MPPAPRQSVQIMLKPLGTHAHSDVGGRFAPTTSQITGCLVCGDSHLIRSGCAPHAPHPTPDSLLVGLWPKMNRGWVTGIYLKHGVTDMQIACILETPMHLTAQNHHQPTNREKHHSLLSQPTGVSTSPASAIPHPPRCTNHAKTARHTRSLGRRRQVCTDYIPDHGLSGLWRFPPHPIRLRSTCSPPHA
jgi:hypothetical protein